MSLTTQEAAVISAFTGVMLGNFSDLHEYAEKVLGRPIWTHEFGSREVADALKEAARPDFLALEIIG